MPAVVAETEMTNDAQAWNTQAVVFVEGELGCKLLIALVAFNFTNNRADAIYSLATIKL